jgi:gibberellin A4 carboxyl methyltransferase
MTSHLSLLGSGQTADRFLGMGSPPVPSEDPCTIALYPPHCLHIATSFNAIGFLGRRPIDRLPGYILPNGPSRIRGVGTVSEADQTVFAEQASRDIESFLRARAVELVPGGKLLLQVFGSSDAKRCCDGVYDVLNDAVLEVLNHGMIDRAVL